MENVDDQHSCLGNAETEVYSVIFGNPATTRRSTLQRCSLSNSQHLTMTFSLFHNEAASPKSASAAVKAYNLHSISQTTPPDVYTKHGEESFRLVMARENGADGTEWRVAKSSDGMTVSRGIVPNVSWHCIKSTSRMPCSMTTLADKLNDAKEMTTFDEMTSSCEVLPSLAPSGTSVRHVKAKPIFPTQTREFVVISSEHKAEDGSMIVIATRSIHHEDVPEVSHLTRATMILSGYIIRAIDDHTCELTVIAHIDLGGLLPATVINLLATETPLQLMKRMQRLYGRRPASPSSRP
ncbi:hypothetical protein LEN26_014480 [Aphanomyces euteiches]|nr:hypothetical protein LEN26_014480 [Aphanomyces euteiches]KAH9184992.1 hypothetical protein AeNC1_013030 [Aphanomyces euteiches]